MGVKGSGRDPAMAASPLDFVSALTAARAIRRGDVSSVGLTARMLARIQQLNPRLNAIVTLTFHIHRAVLGIERRGSVTGHRARPMDEPLELFCWGSAILARINGKEVARVDDATLDSGHALIGAGSTPGSWALVHARFDNLVVGGP